MCKFVTWEAGSIRKLREMPAFVANTSFVPQNNVSDFAVLLLDLPFLQPEHELNSRKFRHLRLANHQFDQRPTCKPIQRGQHIRYWRNMVKIDIKLRY